MLASLTDGWKKAALAGATFMFIYVHVFALPFTPVWWVGDQMNYLANADKMIDGATLYRDVFQFNLPGTEVLYYLVMRLFGPSLWIPSVALLVVGTATTLLVFSLASKVLPDRIALLASAAFLFIVVRYHLDATHHWYSTFAVLLSVNLIAERCTRWRLVAVGAILAVATLFSSNRGVFALLGVAIFLAYSYGLSARAAKSIALLSIPFVAILSGAILCLLHTIGWKLLVDSILIFPLRYWSSYQFDNFTGFWMDLASCFPLRRQAIGSILTLTTMELGLAITLIAFFARRIRNRDRTPRNSEPEHTLMLYALVATSMAIATIGSPSTIRLVCCAPFGFILAFEMLHDVKARPSVWVGLSVALLLLGVAQVVAASTHWSATLRAPRGTVVIRDPATYRFYSWLLERSNQNDALFGNPDLNFVFGMKNPAILSFVTTSAFTRPEQIQNVIASLEQFHVRFVYLYGETDPLGTPSDGLAPLRKYLREHYFVAQMDDGGNICFERQTYSSPPRESQSIAQKQ